MRLFAGRDAEMLTSMNDEIKFKVFSVQHNCWLTTVPDNRFAFILPYAEQDSTCGYKYVTLHNALSSILYRVFRATNEKDEAGQQVYEGDILRFTHTYIPYTYNHCDIYKKEPIKGAEVTDTFTAEVVFGEITDIDDFYCPSTFGWGIRREGQERVSALREAIKTYNEKSLDFSSCRRTTDATWAIIGNVCENPELIKE